MNFSADHKGIPAKIVSDTRYNFIPLINKIHLKITDIRVNILTFDHFLITRQFFVWKRGITLTYTV